MKAMAADTTEYAPVSVSIYQLESSQPLILQTTTNGVIEAPLFSGSTSKWVKATPPLVFSKSDSKLSASWIPPDNESGSGSEYILIVHTNTLNVKPPQIFALSLTGVNNQEPSLVILNLQDQVLDCSFNGQDFISNTGRDACSKSFTIVFIRRFVIH